MDGQYYVLLVGYVVVSYVIYKCLTLLWVLFRCYILTLFGFAPDLRKYGEWVIVTGATDGIGKQYARQFAKRGFKIVLISRTKEKLEKVSKEIEDEYNVETKIIRFNFSQTDGYNDIEEIIKDLDVGILVNNVGMGVSKFQLFDACEINDLCNRMHTNMFSDVRMTHMVIRGMLSRKRGAIIHVSSSSVYIDMPMLNVYAPTKSFMEKFYKLLQAEYFGVIDQQLVLPGIVSTQMSNMKPSFGVPSAEDYVASAIRTIGIVSITTGCWIHDLQGALLLALPHKIKWFIGNEFAKREHGYFKGICPSE